MGQFAPHHSWGYSHSTAYSTWPGGGGCTNFAAPALTAGFAGAATSELHASLSAGHHHDLFPTCAAQTAATRKYDGRRSRESGRFSHRVFRGNVLQ